MTSTLTGIPPAHLVLDERLFEQHEHCYRIAADQKLEEMGSALQSVDHQIGALEGQQTELLRQLALVQQQIGAAQAKRVS